MLKLTNTQYINKVETELGTAQSQHLMDFHFNCEFGNSIFLTFLDLFLYYEVVKGRKIMQIKEDNRKNVLNQAIILGICSNFTMWFIQLQNNSVLFLL